LEALGGGAAPAGVDALTGATGAGLASGASAETPLLAGGSPVVDEVLAGGTAAPAAGGAGWASQLANTAGGLGALAFPLLPVALGGIGSLVAGEEHPYGSIRDVDVNAQWVPGQGINVADWGVSYDRDANAIGPAFESARQQRVGEFNEGMNNWLATMPEDQRVASEAALQELIQGLYSSGGLSIGDPRYETPSAVDVGYGRQQMGDPTIGNVVIDLEHNKQQNINQALAENQTKWDLALRNIPRLLEERLGTSFEAYPWELPTDQELAASNQAYQAKLALAQQDWEDYVKYLQNMGHEGG